MKFKTTLATIAFMIASTGYASGGGASGRESGGGDVLVMNFKSAGKAVCNFLKTANQKERYGLNARQFCDAVRAVKVTSQERTFLADGTEVDAVNTPSIFEIRLSQKRNFSKTMKEMIQLSAHEYISVLGINDRNYQISAKLNLKIINSSNASRRAACIPFLAATYECNDAFKRTIKISSRADVYTLVGLYSVNKSFKADGRERLVSYEPAGPDRDTAYEAYLTAYCVSGGLEIQTRNNDFSPLDPRTGKYNLVGSSTSFDQIQVSPDAYEIRVSTIHKSLNFSSGKISETSDRLECQRLH